MRERALWPKRRMKVEGTCENRFRENKVQNEFRVAEREGLLKLQLEEAGTLRQYRPSLRGGAGRYPQVFCSGFGILGFTTNHPGTRSLTSLSFSSLLSRREIMIVPTLQGCGGGNYTE